jgi:hypothetical protein
VQSGELQADHATVAGAHAAGGAVMIGRTSFTKIRCASAIADAPALK